MRRFRKITSLLLAALFSVGLAVPAGAAETAAAIRLSKTEGTVAVTNAASRGMSVREKMLLYSGYHVSTQAESYAWLQLDEDRLSKLDASSEVEVRKSGKQLELLLKSGNISFNVSEPLKEDETLNIRTSTMAMGVRGTCGWVQVVDQVTTRVCLLEGSVACTATDPASGQKKTLVISAGQSAEFVVTPDNNDIVRCEVDQTPVTQEDIPGYFLVDLVETPELCDLIFDASGIDLREVTVEQALEKQAQEQAAWSQVVQSVEQAEAEQERITSLDPVWESSPTPVPSASYNDSSSNDSDNDNDSDDSSPTPTPVPTATPSPSPSIGPTVSFDANGGAFDGSTEPVTVSVSEGDCAQLPSDPTWADHTFSGWNTQADGSGTSFTASTPVTADLTVYAQWVAYVKLSAVLGDFTALTDALASGSVRVVNDSTDPSASAELAVASGAELTIASGRSLTLDSSICLTNSGAISVADGGTLTVEGALENSGTITVEGTMTTSGAVTNSGTMTVNSSNTLNVNGPFTNYHTLKITSSGRVAVGSAGSIKNTGSTGSIPDTGNNGAAVVTDGMVGGIVIEADGQLDLPSADLLENEGWLLNLNDGTLDLGAKSEGCSIDGRSPWEDYAAQIISVTLGSGITSIDEAAFSGYTGLTSVSIPASVTTIGARAFDGCESLNVIRVPSTVANVGGIAFPETTRVFYNGDSIPSYDEVNESGWDNSCGGVFFFPENSAGDTWYQVEDNVLTITGTGVMATYTSTTAAPWGMDVSSVTIESGVTSIGDYAFRNCTGLEAISIPASVKTIGDSAFTSCTSLTGVTFADGSQLTTISDNAFSACSVLETINIPESVTTIGDYAFQSCSRLTGITLPEGVTSIGTFTFQSCTALTGIIIPEGVTSIGTSAFYSCTALASVSIPASVTSIGFRTFLDCVALTDVTFVDGSLLTTIGDYAFSGCKVLTSLTLPASVTSIGAGVFPESTRVFYSGDSIPDSSCGGVFFFPENSAGNTWYQVEGGALTITGTGVMATYTSETAAPWGTDISSVTIESGVTSVGDYAFNGCSSLNSASIPDSVTSIGDGAFNDCLSRMTIIYQGTTDTWAKISGRANLAGKTLTIEDTGYTIDEDGNLVETAVRD